METYQFSNSGHIISNIARGNSVTETGQRRLPTQSGSFMRYRGDEIRNRAKVLGKEDVR